MADDNTNDGTGNTMKPDGSMKPLKERQRLRELRREEEKALGSDLNHAEALRDIAAAEASGERGPEAQARRQTLGTAETSGDDTQETEQTDQTDEQKAAAAAAAGAGWGPGSGSAGGTAQGNGVSASAAAPAAAPKGRRKNA